MLGRPDRDVEVIVEKMVDWTPRVTMKHTSINTSKYISMLYVSIPRSKPTSLSLLEHERTVSFASDRTQAHASRSVVDSEDTWSLKKFDD